MNVVSWDEWFLDFCYVASQRSKDPTTKVGAIIVRDKRVIATGYNGFPAGVFETLDRWQRPVKYDFVVHAEENAILQAARYGAAIDGAVMYSLLKPCKHCAKLIANSGLRAVYYDAKATNDYQDANALNPHGFDVGDIILEEARVKCLSIWIDRRAVKGERTS